MNKLKILKQMVHDNLQDLKKSALKFEEVVNESKDMDDLSHSSLDVFGESKSALDYSMALLREKDIRMQRKRFSTLTMQDPKKK